MLDVPRAWRAIVAVDEEGQFSRAAARLGMSQPQLSRLIINAEHRLGLTIFHRRPRATATAAGEVLIEAIRRAIDDTSHAATKARRVAEGASGHVTVGFVSTVMAGSLPKSLQAFLRSHPEIQLTLKEMHSSEQVQAIRDGNVEIAIGREKSAGADIRSELLFEEPLLAAISSSHRLADASEIAIHDLANEAFVLFERSCAPALHDTILEVCTAAGFTPHVGHHAREWHTILALVAAQYGVTIVPASLRALTWPNLVFRPLSSVRKTVATYLHWPRHGPTPAAQLFLQEMRSLRI